jgi:hypothetical protein
MNVLSDYPWFVDNVTTSNGLWQGSNHITTAEWFINTVDDYGTAIPVSSLSSWTLSSHLPNLNASQISLTYYMWVQIGSSQPLGTYTGWTAFTLENGFSHTIENVTIICTVAAPNPTLLIAAITGGTTNPIAGLYTNYTTGDTVTVYETPSSGYQWSRWFVNSSLAGSANPLTFNITGYTIVQPMFTPIIIIIPPPPSSSFTLIVLVTNKTQNVQGAVITISGGYLGTTDTGGTAIFSLPESIYVVAMVYDGITQSKTLNLTSDQQLTFDISSPSPPPSNPIVEWIVGVKPWWFWLVVVAIGIVVVAAIVVRVKGKKNA